MLFRASRFGVVLASQPGLKLTVHEQRNEVFVTYASVPHAPWSGNPERQSKAAPCPPAFLAVVKEPVQDPERMKCRRRPASCHSSDFKLSIRNSDRICFWCSARPHARKGGAMLRQVVSNCQQSPFDMHPGTNLRHLSHQQKSCSVVWGTNLSSCC